MVGYHSLRAFGFELRWERAPADRSGRARKEVPLIAAAPVTRRAAQVTAEDDSLADAFALGPSVEPRPSRSTVLIPPPLNDTVAVGTGVFSKIDFASFPDGRGMCINCAVGDEWASMGVRFSFRSWTSDSSRPFVLDARNFLPDGADTPALGPALRGAQGLEVGVLRLDFPGRPRKVALTLYGPDLIPRFDVVGWTGGGILGPSAVTRTVECRYRPAGRGLFRSERVLIEAAEGIDRVSLDGWGPPGHILLIQALAIDP